MREIVLHFHFLIFSRYNLFFDFSTLFVVIRSLPDLRDGGHFVCFNLVQVSCWSGFDLVVGFLCEARCPPISFFCCLCIFAFQRPPSSSVFCRIDPCAVVLLVISCCRISFFRLEEFVDLIFPSSFFWLSHTFVLYFVLKTKFQSTAFTSHFSTGIVAILIAFLHFMLL